jgi:hypothetical protein
MNMLENAVALRGGQFPAWLQKENSVRWGKMSEDQTRMFQLRRFFTPSDNRRFEEILTSGGQSVLLVREVIPTLPARKWGSTFLHFFKVMAPVITAREIPAFYELHKLAYANPYTLAEWNGKNPEFSRLYPNATFWQAGKSRLNFLDFWEGHAEKRRAVCGDAELMSFGQEFWFVGEAKK